MNTHPLMIAAQLEVDEVGGAEKAGARLGKAASTVAHEVSGSGTAKFGLIDGARLTRYSPHKRIATAFAAEAGGVFIQLPDSLLHSAGSEDIDIAALVNSFGQMLSGVATAMADRKVTDNELAEVRELVLKVIGEAQVVLGGMAVMNARGKPAHLQTAM